MTSTTRSPAGYAKSAEQVDLGPDLVRAQRERKPGTRGERPEERPAETNPREPAPSRRQGVPGLATRRDGVGEKRASLRGTAGPASRPQAPGVPGDELDGDEQIRVLRAYLKKWKFEVGAFFDGLGPDSSDQEFRAIAKKHPAFSLEAAS